MKNKNKFVCLMSAGTDSPVACYLMIENGFIPIIVHFYRAPLDPKSDKILQNGLFKLIEILTNFTKSKIKTYLISHIRMIKELEKSQPGKSICILCRRTMYRIAKRIAERENAKVIVTGESIGEKASQTPKNLAVMKQAIDNFLLIQPLIALNKLRIESLAKKIGTYHASIQKTYECSATPRYPVTHANLEKILSLENKLNLEKIIQDSLNHAEILFF
ncbi:MAG: hypothetical protein ACTSO9_17185 [Candidatus Helarchaeota archaeon]